VDGIHRLSQAWTKPQALLISNQRVCVILMYILVRLKKTVTVQVCRKKAFLKKGKAEH